MSELIEDNIWWLVEDLAKNTNCKDRAVGCVIHHNEHGVVGKGWNIHLDDKCDCDSTKTAQHAEVTALHDMLGPYNREDLIAFVNHQPCFNCASALETVVKEVRYRSQK